MTERLEQMKRLVDSVLKRADLYSPEAAELVFLTGLVESKYKYIYQIGGPARGYFQVEPFTAWDICINYLSFRRSTAVRYAKVLNLEEEVLMHPTEELMEEMLEDNIALGILLCRLKYYRVPHPLPTDVDGMAAYWKQFYNAGGKGTVKHFLETVDVAQNHKL
jgi:hypothetical protein|tara:strand:- start:17429 stop:17917 length:489 start_codon:yes stop_codon:yes gene_type:complete